MAINKAMYTGTSAILAGYQALSQTPYYSVWMTSPKEMLFQYNEDDKESGIEKLMELCAGGEANGNTDLLVIKFHGKKEKGFITDKTPVIGSMPIRICEVGNTVQSGSTVSGNSGAQGMSYQMYEAINSLKQLPEMLKQQMAPIMLRLEALEAAEVEQEDGVPDTIGAVIFHHLKDPQIANRVLDFISPVIRPGASLAVGSVPNNQNTQLMPQHQERDISQVDNDKLNAALIRLHEHCILDQDIPLLADLAEKNPAMFQMALNIVRNQ